MLDYCWEMPCLNKLLLLKTIVLHVLSCYAKCGYQLQAVVAAAILMGPNYSSSDEQGSACIISLK